ncbi:peptidoglycan binding domain protein [Oceanicola granulosus HTCC2516]|uniref:Peptidoglycan binding domain protein n=1 Tax=Oceanicola granulosus (strain ATCC BAA-861 / DSM 15982 / KCTC 12143 / HTCC2516) TaxID=314256 RepID=Q2CD57_OCEGH|nr:lytic murein transglycosylase [Oceanicola granulosus]EAR50621.1 peptidoglycan binding domain protein [Oceanicola granulosus HTCC2516]
MSADEQRSFTDWHAAFRERARQRGNVGPAALAAFDALTPDPEVLQRDRSQAELVRPIWDYLDRAVTDARVDAGRALLSERRELFGRISERYGVAPEIVVAIWGVETGYGRDRGRFDVLRALATLAADGRRRGLFEAQLMAALRIHEDGDAREMRGSWAGAMGHTQFMPTSYLAYAVDFDGDGRRDIWSDDPTDALASTAAYLARFGWQSGAPWGHEVRLPEGFDLRLADRRTRRGGADWARLGVARADGGLLDEAGEGALLLPAGAEGVAFLALDNFRVVERYNRAVSYVLAVGHLADRLAGRGPLVGTWPRQARVLETQERRELQERLTSAGFCTRGADGLIGPDTVAAVRAYQLAHGLRPDGYASVCLLERLR